MLAMIMYIPLSSVQQSLCADTTVWPTCTNSSILQELPGREKNPEPPVQKKPNKTVFNLSKRCCKIIYFIHFASIFMPRHKRTCYRVIQAPFTQCNVSLNVSGNLRGLTFSHICKHKRRHFFYLCFTPAHLSAPFMSG